MEITEKNKKNEILDAYYDLLTKVQQTSIPTHQEVKQKQQTEEIIVRADSFDTEHIVHTFAELKLTVAQNLSGLEKRVTEEYSRLNDLQEAIKAESKNLQEIHEIKKNADSLAALLLAQKEYKAKFEAEITEQKEEFEATVVTKREQWRLDQEKHNLELKELGLV